MRGSAARSGAIQVESETSGGGAPDEPNGVRRGGHHTGMGAIGPKRAKRGHGPRAPFLYDGYVCWETKSKGGVCFNG